MTIVREIWNYRSFIFGSIKREFQLKYQNSMLGIAWNVINPLAMIVVYTVIFQRVMHSRLPGVDNSFAYSIYLCSGILTWGLFLEITARIQNVFIENANLVKKLSFPRIILPVIIVLSAVVNFIISFSLFIGFLLVSNSFPGWPFFSVFPVLLIQVIFSLGLGLSLGVLNVFFRDIGHLFGIVLQFWFWFTPIVYPITILPKELHNLLILNPMATLVQAYQTIFVYGSCPQWQDLVPPSLFAVALSLLGFYLFRKYSGEMVDEL